jgi:hypothetical protein
LAFVLAVYTAAAYRDRLLVLAAALPISLAAALTIYLTGQHPGDRLVDACTRPRSWSGCRWLWGDTSPIGGDGYSTTVRGQLAMPWPRSAHGSPERCTTPSPTR